MPAAVIVGGGLAIGGALAIATYDSGGGGGGDSKTVDGNYGGNYNLCFVPGASTNGATNATTVCDNGLVNVYVTNGTARVVGLWGGETLGGPVNGSLFSAVADVGATAEFPSAHLIAAGEISGSACTVRIDGYSTDPLRPGNFSGQAEMTKR